MQHWMANNVVLTALLVLVGGWLLLKSWPGRILVVLLILVFMVNPRLFSGSDLPIGGGPGNVLQVGQFGDEAQSREAICLGKAVTARTAKGANPRLAGTAAACQSAQVQAVQQCVRQPANALVVDKLVKCQGEHEPAWSRCMSTALTGHADDGTSAVAQCGENRLIGLMRDVAGMFSLKKWFPPKPPVYQDACLRDTFNVYANQRPTPLPSLNCDQIVNQPAQLQTCIIKSLTQGLGDQGLTLVSRCEVK